MESFECIAKTFHGLEELLAQELTDLGADKVRTLKRAVSFQGDLEMLYRANLHCRTAVRILKTAYSFPAKDETELYEKVSDIPWEDFLQLGQTFAIDSTVFSESFKHSKYASLKMKDAIVDRFKKKSGRRPDVDTRNPDLQLNLHISHERVNIGLDSSGETLNRRGYRASGHVAPLNEVLAAGMVMLSGWDKEQTFYDPMCGSGTLPIEAAMMACRIPPGYHRKHFGFMDWPDYDEEIWKNLIKEAEGRMDLEADVDIRGSEMKGLYVRMAKSAAKAVGLHGRIRFFQGDFFEQSMKDSMIMMNPPYGERIGHRYITDFYADIADHLKQSFTGSTVWILSSNEEALKYFGLRPSRRIRLFNGPLECSFQKFELNKGTKKVHKLSDDYRKPYGKGERREFKDKGKHRTDRGREDSRSYDRSRNTSRIRRTDSSFKEERPRNTRPERPSEPRHPSDYDPSRDKRSRGPKDESGDR